MANKDYHDQAVELLAKDYRVLKHYLKYLSSLKGFDHLRNTVEYKGSTFKKYLSAYNKDMQRIDLTRLERWAKDGYIEMHIQEGCVPEVCHYSPMHKASTVDTLRQTYIALTDVTTILRLPAFSSTIVQIAKKLGVTEKHNDTLDAMCYAAMKPLTKKIAEEKSMNFQKTIQSVKNSFNLTLNLTKGRTALAAVHSSVMKVVPMNFGFLARITGKQAQVVEHPGTKLAVAMAVNSIAQERGVSKGVLEVTQAAQDYAMLQVAELLPIEQTIDTVLSEIEDKVSLVNKSDKKKDK